MQPLSEAEPLQKTPQVFRLQEGGEVGSALLIGCAVPMWWALVYAGPAGVICCRSTDSGHHHTTQGRVFSPRHLSQGRTNLLPSFGVYPFFGPAPNVFLEMQSRRDRSSASRMRNERQPFLHIFTTIWDIFLHSNNTHTHTHEHTQILKPYWKHGLKNWK